jgi:hypothetical protein
MNDRRLIYAAAFLRALATGMAGVLLGLTLARLGFSAAVWPVCRCRSAPA